jgi:hypothetical protein
MSVSGATLDPVRRLARVDCGYASFLPLCPSCSWRGLPRSTRDAAAAVADRHAVAVHADKRARDAADLRARRLAEAGSRIGAA